MCPSFPADHRRFTFVDDIDATTAASEIAFDEAFDPWRHREVRTAARSYSFTSIIDV